MNKTNESVRNNLAHIQNPIEADIAQLKILKAIYQNLDETDMKELLTLSSETEKHEYPLGVLTLCKKYPDAELAEEGIEYLEGLLKRWVDISSKVFNVKTVIPELPEGVKELYKNGIPEDVPEDFKKLLSGEMPIDHSLIAPKPNINPLPNLELIKR